MSTLMLEIGISLLSVGTPEVAFPKERHCVRSTELDRSQCMTSLWEELCAHDCKVTPVQTPKRYLG